MSRLFESATPLQSGDMRSRQYQELKGRVHNELLGRLNLERLAEITADNRDRSEHRGDGERSHDRFRDACHVCAILRSSD